MESAPDSPPEQSKANEQDEAYNKVADAMKERGLVADNSKEYSQSMQAGFALGRQDAIMHEACTDADCGICGVRNKIAADSFKRGLEKGARLAEMMRAAPQ